MQREVLAQTARLMLLQGRTWRYLRYLHFRHMFRQIAMDVKTVCVCGAGHGLAELAVAAEFPDVKFILTDVINRDLGYPNYHRAMDLAWKHGVENIEFSIWNTLRPTSRHYDLVCSTEMLEHIKRADKSATNMRQCAKKYIYCLVPFADDATNANERKRKEAWERHQHYVYGYDDKSLRRLFPDPINISGAYWSQGRAFRQRLTKMDNDQIEAQQQGLEEEASADLIDAVPLTLKDALGIKILSAVK